MMKPTALPLIVSLAAASLGFAQPAPQEASSGHAWQQSQKADTAGTFTYTQFTLAGKFLTPPHDKAAGRPALVLDCIPGSGSHAAKGRLLGANLLVGIMLKIVYVEPEEIRGTSYYPKVVARYQIDGAKAEEDKWTAGTDKTSVAIPKDALKQLLRAHKVAITTDDDHGSQVAMQFEIPDPTMVEQGCRVDEHMK
jgi:hypothetical protein